MNLISLLSQILGDYKEMGKGEHYFHCPFCHHHHKKFAVNIIKNKWKCWICGARGNNLIGLFKKLEDAKLARMKKANELFGEFTNKCEIETMKAKPNHGKTNKS